jgi:hypothetical protein
MGYPPTDYLGFTIKTKDRKVFKHQGRGIIFDTRELAQAWIDFNCAEFDKPGSSHNSVLVANERLALEGCEIINVQGNL